MVITRQGDGYFKLQSGERAVLIDPDNQRSYKGSLLIVATMRPPQTGPEDGGPFFVDGQGEYDVSEIRIEGRTAEHEGEEVEKTAYRIVFDDITIGILGPVKKEPDPKVVEILQDCDILVLPGGEKPYLNASAIAKVVRQTEPGIVIPSFVKDPKELLKELGQENSKPEEKLTLKKKDISPKAMTVVWLTV